MITGMNTLRTTSNLLGVGVRNAQPNKGDIENNLYLWYCSVMGKITQRIVPNETPLTATEFLESFNSNMPLGYPHVTLDIMKKFQQAHQSLFKKPNIWTLELHRKRMIQWLPQNLS
jgi:hypothetical protein